MFERLVHALIASPNQAADAALLESLDLGNPNEKHLALGALIRRGTIPGLTGVIDRYQSLPDHLKLATLSQIRTFGPALSDAARSLSSPRRLSSIKLIALGRQGRLGYVLLENLGTGDQRTRNASIEAITALARWVSTQSRLLQTRAADLTADDRAAYANLLEQRPEIEATVFRALERQQQGGIAGAELVRAALLLADTPESQTQTIVRSARHPGPLGHGTPSSRSPLRRTRRRLPLHRRPCKPAIVLRRRVSHVSDRPTLDAILRRTHWLKDWSLAACHQTLLTGKWLDEISLSKDLSRRPARDAGLIASWITASGTADVHKDLLLSRAHDKTLSPGCAEDPAPRLHLLRALMTFPKTVPLPLLKTFLTDPDERLCRLAARELRLRKLPGHQGILLAAIQSAAPSVRRVIGRSVGEAGFRTFLARYDRLAPAARRSAARAVVKILPDATRRLSSLLTSDTPTAERLRALQLTTESDMTEPMRDILLRLCTDDDPRVRSKAVSTSAGLSPLPREALVERMVRDTNPRVRANAIEVLDIVREHKFLPLLTGRAKSAENNRERANAIKALHTMSPADATPHLAQMLSDPRPMHRISAMWALRHTHQYNRLAEVGRLAREDSEPAVRRYAVGTLKHAAAHLRTTQGAAA